LQAFFAANGLIGVAVATASVRGTDPAWSVSDGTTFVQLRSRGGSLQALADPGAAISATLADPRSARPSAVLTAAIDGLPTTWRPEPDLLASRGDAFAFTCETDTDATVYLRFGDDEHGRRPGTGTAFDTTYRVGTGTAGNVGAEALGHAITIAPVTGVRNPLPAAGGVEPESADEVRRDAPYAFLVQERAVTPDDWAEVTERDPGIQRAAATYRWTGSWHTVFLTADRFGGAAVDTAFETGLRAEVEQYRLAGYDLEINSPVFVALELGLTVCVVRDQFRSDVLAAVLEVLSDHVLSDGSLGLFHPNRFTFGQPVYLSAVYAAVHAVPGVDSVDVHTFQRLREPETTGLDGGVLPMGRLEIARLDNDPNFPEHGTLTLTMGGGT
jgi:predicted phage baseplate assembly protein